MHFKYSFLLSIPLYISIYIYIYIYIHIYIILQPRKVMLNVIPYNPTTVIQKYQAPTTIAVQRFCAIVRAHSVVVILRQELGQDINGACGQLVVSALAPNFRAPGEPTSLDIEDFNGGGKPKKNDACGKIVLIKVSDNTEKMPPPISR